MIESEKKDTLYRLLGKSISEQRANVGYTQEKLADLLEISRISVAKIETGKQKPPLHLLYLIALVLKTDVLDLIPKVKLSDDVDINKSFKKKIDNLEKRSHQKAIESFMEELNRTDKL